MPFKKSKRDLVFHLFTVYQTVHGGSRLRRRWKLLYALLDVNAGLEPAPAWFTAGLSVQRWHMLKKNKAQINSLACLPIPPDPHCCRPRDSNPHGNKSSHQSLKRVKKLLAVLLVVIMGSGPIPVFRLFLKKWQKITRHIFWPALPTELSAKRHYRNRTCDTGFDRPKKIAVCAFICSCRSRTGCNISPYRLPPWKKEPDYKIQSAVGVSIPVDLAWEANFHPEAAGSAFSCLCGSRIRRLMLNKLPLRPVFS